MIPKLDEDSFDKEWLNHSIAFSNNIITWAIFDRFIVSDCHDYEREFAKSWTTDLRLYKVPYSLRFVVSSLRVVDTFITISQ